MRKAALLIWVLVSAVLIANSVFARGEKGKVELLSMEVPSSVFVGAYYDVVVKFSSAEGAKILGSVFIWDWSSRSATVERSLADMKFLAPGEFSVSFYNKGADNYRFQCYVIYSFNGEAKKSNALTGYVRAR